MTTEESKFPPDFLHKHLRDLRLGENFIIYGYKIQDLSKEDLMALVIKFAREKCDIAPPYVHGRPGIH